MLRLKGKVLGKLGELSTYNEVEDIDNTIVRQFHLIASIMDELQKF